MLILGIETSCDETCVAIYDDKKGLLSNKLYSQIPLHANYGGVVPELASRNHVSHIVPLIKDAITQVPAAIDGIAYTAGPGLIGALMVGATVGKALAYACGVPSIAIHHMEGHILAPMLEANPPQYPFVALLVSGGNTQLVKVTDIGVYKLLGESIDDTAGEAFDKIAKLLGINYPGGPILSRIAQKGRAGRYTFPRPMTDRPGLDFSFSGLKTFVANIIRISDHDDQTKADIARAFEDAIIDTLAIKCHRALDKTGLKRLVIAGGVSANNTLRKRITKMMHQHDKEVFFARPDLCTDNAAMIAYAGMIRLKYGVVEDDLAISVRPRWSIAELPAIKKRKLF